MNALGRHILVEYYNCDPDILNDVIFIEESMVKAAKDADATVINSSFHHFSPFGVSGVVVIQESHLAIHTWPEYGYAAVDIFTCGDSIDPWFCYQRLKDDFKADYGSAMEALRGQSNLLKKNDFKLEGEWSGAPNEIKASRDLWFTERDDLFALSLKHTGEKIYRKTSQYQRVEVLNTLAYGKLLTLDGLIMTTEKDEFIYHEMITHVAMQSHPNPKQALIIGGGDGGAARELLRYESLEEVVMVEIDELVIEAARLHLPGISCELDNPRLNLIIGDGIKYVKDSQDEAFDIVIIDSTDPIGPAEGLFSKDFYQDVHRILKPDGIMVVQSESPHFNKDVFAEIINVHQGIFGLDKVHCYLAMIPTYPSGTWSFSFSTKSGLDPLTVNSEKVEAFSRKHHLKYYNSQIHSAAFALPGFVKEILNQTEA